MFRWLAPLLLTGCYASHEREAAIDARSRDSGRSHDAATRSDANRRDTGRDADSGDRDADTPPCADARMRGQVRIIGLGVDDERHRIAITAWFWPAAACRESREASCDISACDDLRPERHLYAGEMTVSGSFGDVALEYLDGVGKYESGVAPRPPPEWEGGERITVHASGAEFPPFDIAVDLPLPIPGGTSPGRPGTVSFAWHSYPDAQVYLEAQRGSLDSGLFAVCTESSEVGSLTLPPAVEARFAPVTYFMTGGSRTTASSCSGDAYVELVANAEELRGPVVPR